MDDDLHQFLNRMRILHCIDGYEIEQEMAATGLEMTEKRWNEFRRSPTDFMICADDPTQAALWSIIQRREAKRREAKRRDPVKAVLV